MTEAENDDLLGKGTQTSSIELAVAEMMVLISVLYYWSIDFL